MSGWGFPQNVVLSGALNHNVNLVLDPASRSLLAGLQAGISAIHQEIMSMSATLQQQMQQATQEITADMQDMSSELDTIQQGVTDLAAKAQPGYQLTQADVDALKAARSAADSVKAKADQVNSNLQSINNPAPGPTPTPTPPGP